jgi:thioredoxin reductase/bacterioferritin-associated ferredoxin
MPPKPPDPDVGSNASLPASCDVAVVGAGPAGIAAATLAAELGLDTVLLDEQSEPGGELFRDLAAASPQRRVGLGPEYEHGMALLAALDRSRVQPVAGASVAGAQLGPEDFELCVARGGKASIMHARCVILATGAVERPLQIEGSMLAGVTTARTSLRELQTSAPVPEGRVVLAGCGPLLYLAAQQLRRAGADVVGLLDTLSARRFVRALPSAVEFMRSPYYARGAKLLREINDTVPIYHDVIELAALGNDKLTSVRFTANKRTQTLIVDRLVLHQGIVPEIHLADLLGCDMRWDDAMACWAPKVDAWGASSVPGVSIAGDGAGIMGAGAAAQRGALSALGSALALARIDAAKRDAMAAAHRHALAQALRGRRFLDTVYRPPERFRVPQGEAIVCHCEGVSARDLIEAVREGCAGPNQLKASTRCGMGACQGRDCGLAVTELIARERGVHPSVVGRFRARFPVRPLTLGQLASLPSSVADRGAVTRLLDD